MVGVLIPQLSVITSTHFPLRELVVKNFKSMGVGFPCGSIVKNPPANAGDWVPSLGWEDPLEKKLLINVILWKIYTVQVKYNLP